MIFNLIHRPKPGETYDFQRKCVHDLNLKATILIPTELLEDEKTVSVAKQDNELFGGEVGLWISPMPTQPNTQVWLLCEADKRATVKYFIDKYIEIFGHAPKSVGNYLNYRILIDTFQGGSIGDFRPYIGKYAAFTGVDSDNLIMNSYPYLIQSQYRTGLKNHFEDGSRTTLFVHHNNETLDMCNYPTKIENVKTEENCTKLTLSPVELTFNDGLTIKRTTA